MKQFKIQTDTGLPKWEGITLLHKGKPIIVVAVEGRTFLDRHTLLVMRYTDPKGIEERGAFNPSDLRYLGTTPIKEVHDDKELKDMRNKKRAKAKEERVKAIAAGERPDNDADADPDDGDEEAGSPVEFDIDSIINAAILPAPAVKMVKRKAAGR